jgi:hypothetical protein
VCDLFNKCELFHEEISAVLCLKDTTRGEVLYEVLTGFLNCSELDVKKILQIKTDGAMVATNKVLFWRLTNDYPNLISYYCIIHEIVLCCKLDPRLESSCRR